MLRYARLERLLVSPSSPLGLSCRRCASSSSAAVVKSIADESGPQIAVQSSFLDTAAEPSRRPKVQEYLDYVAENSRLTLSDLERLKPESHSPPGSAQYEDEYEAVMQKLDRAFTVSQLRQFLNLYGLRVSSRIRKLNAATTIIEKQWGWPSLSKSQKLARSQKETSSRVFPLSPQQAFLLLGNDGADILSLSRTYSVRLQFSHQPLSLKIAGTTASVEQLERHVATLTEDITWQDFLPPYNLDLSTSSQKLSRVSGCFLESLQDGKIRIWYLKSSSETLSKAKRLIMQFAIESFQVPLMASIVKDNFPLPLEHAPSYAFYPFFCEPPNQMLNNKAYFRLRRVGKWFSDEDQMVLETISGDVNRGYLPIVGDCRDPREQLQGQTAGLDGVSEVSVTATPGHIVLCSVVPQSCSLSPPFEGQRNLGGVIDWVKEGNPHTDFIRSVPTRLWQAPQPNQHWRRRLTYETIPTSAEPGQSMIFEYRSTAPVKEGFELFLESVESGTPKDPVLRFGTVTRLDLLMPDNSRDIRLTLNNNYTIAATQWPIELLNLLENESSSSTSEDVPLSITHKDKSYILRDDFFLQSCALPVQGEYPTVQTISERRLDPHSDASYLTYQVTCSDITSDDSWKLFWSHCERVVQDGPAP